MNNPATDKQYVYKYVAQDGTVVYVGITNNLKKRIAQHEHDKLKVIANPTIMYFPVKHRHDAEMLETYLINNYGTGEYFNVKKKDRGDVSFLGECDSLPWITFDGCVKDAEPFVVGNVVKTKVVEVVKKEKVVRYVDSRSSTEDVINKFHQENDEILEYLYSEQEEESQIVNFLNGLTQRNNPLYDKKIVSDDNVICGLELHSKRLVIINDMIDFFETPPITRDNTIIYKLLNDAQMIKREIDNHEQNMAV